MPTLIDLKAQFLRYFYNKEHGLHSMAPVDTIEEAQGVRFLCPKCFVDNGGAKGTHIVICWSSERGTPDQMQPGPGRWKLVGTGLHDLTLDGERGRTRSVALNGGCCWHGYITNGEGSPGA